MTQTSSPRPYTTVYTRRGPGHYKAVVTNAAGRTVTFFHVYRTETRNAAARGGATRPEWIAEHGGRKFHGDTRAAALHAAIADRFPSFLR